MNWKIQRKQVQKGSILSSCFDQLQIWFLYTSHCRWPVLWYTLLRLKFCFSGSSKVPFRRTCDKNSQGCRYGHLRSASPISQLIYTKFSFKMLSTALQESLKLGEDKNCGENSASTKVNLAKNHVYNIKYRRNDWNLIDVRKFYAVQGPLLQSRRLPRSDLPEISRPKQVFFRVVFLSREF